jgi:capsular exopolysaccharide synthesis family protein
MSKNFELLQQAEQAHEAEVALFTQDAHAYAAPPASVPSFTADSRTALEMNDLSREEIKKLVQRLFRLPGAVRSVAFAGIDRSTGCSWMASRVAEVLAAQMTGSVCVVDANLRAPALHSVFSMQNHYGFTDALLQPGPVRQFTYRLASNLWLLSCGSIASTGQNMLNSERVQARFAELRNEFNYVLIDTPALSVCTDPIAIGHLTDGVVLVVEANVTRREAVRKAAKDLESANVRVLGMVLNKRVFPIPELLYNRL